MVPLKKILSRIDTNLQGQGVSQNIIVFESDDWGAIRMPSIQVRDKLISIGHNLSEEVFTMQDGLEKEQDVNLLMEILKGHKDSLGNHPMFTLNMVMNNPDFSKIKADNFQNYYSESIVNTYDRYSESNKVLLNIKEGILGGVFMPQFHGCEHVNVPLWMKYLKDDQDTFGFKSAFNEKVFGLNKSATGINSPHIQATYDTNDLDYVRSSISKGALEFEKIFGFNSSTFIPNNYVWNPKWNRILLENKFTGLQGMKYSLLPLENGTKRGKARRYFGPVNNNLVNLVRNCDFEQSNKDFKIHDTLDEVKIAFMMKKPAIISTHRINYTSRLGESNRDFGLENLDKLLRSIITKWPDVVFLNSSSLVQYIEGKA